MLNRTDLLTVVTLAPMVSIDLVVVDRDARILVGKRTNEPALGTWFVPGGRVLKNETLDEAFERIAIDELGSGDWSRESARPLGVFEHLYPTNFTGSNGVGTHYVALAYAIPANGLRLDQLPLDQHSAVEWVASGGAASDGRTLALHEYTEAYFAFVDRDRSTSTAVTE
jgi:colanic acid biosynthesis protein WcaH